MQADELLEEPPATPRSRPRATRHALSPAAWIIIVCCAALVVLGLTTAPLAVVIAAAVVLGAALSWRSKAKRSSGSGVVPTAAVWAAACSLVVATGAVAAQGVLGAWNQ